MKTKSKKLSLGVLASGTGTNLQAIIDSCKSGKLDAKINVVISDNPEAKALERAAKAGIPHACIEMEKYSSKTEFERAILEELERNPVDLVCLAGYMRIVGPTLLEKYRQSMINIHPALLPSFPGLNAQRQALEYGAKIAGCTVHFVDEFADHGPIIVQAVVKVDEDETENSLKAKILKEEHRLYPHAIQLIAENRLEIVGRKVRIR